MLDEALSLCLSRTSGAVFKKSAKQQVEEQHGPYLFFSVNDDRSLTAAAATAAPAAAHLRLLASSA